MATQQEADATGPWQVDAIYPREAPSGFVLPSAHEAAVVAAPEKVQPNKVVPGRYIAERMSQLDITIADRLDGESDDLVASIRRAQTDLPSATSVASVTRCKSELYSHCYVVRISMGEYHVATFRERLQTLRPRYVILDMRPIPQ